MTQTGAAKASEAAAERRSVDPWSSGKWSGRRRRNGALTDDQVRAMRLARLDGVDEYEMTRRFGVTLTVVRRVLRMETYRWVRVPGMGADRVW